MEEEYSPQLLDDTALYDNANLTLITPVVSGLSSEENDIMGRLFNVLRKTRPGNLERSRYYYGNIPMRDLGYAMPASVAERASATVGWCAKAVDMLAERSIFDGFTYEDGIDRMNDIVTANDFKGMYRQAVISELTHCCSFFTVTKGDVSSGDPEVLLTAYSAINATALWDIRHKRIKAGLALVDVGKNNQPKAWNLYTDDALIEIENINNRWVANRLPNAMGRPLMEPMPYSPPIDRPFGRPRLSHTVRGLADKARVINGLVSLGSELFTVPKRYLIGGDGKYFSESDKYDALFGTILEVSKDKDGDAPVYGQLAQVSMEPLIGVWKMLAAEFSAETDIPQANLGIVTSNPASAEAMYAEQEPLSIKAERLNERNSIALCNVARMALAIQQNKSLKDLSDEERRVHVLWGDTAHISHAARADATLKQWSVVRSGDVPDVLLEKMGWSESDRIRYREQMDNFTNTSAIDAIANAVRGATNTYRAESTGDEIDTEESN